ncbi:MAG: hypothetical protein EAX96_10120 [Candidatus Lokiarchaeota archaeon]|nr:hypothetical protein [Candidatus Lokiarchaeota archaeon]
MVGKKLPNYLIINTRDERVNLHDFIGKKELVIILLRSKYCPFSRAHLRKLAKDIKKFRELDVELIPILQDNKRNTIKVEEQFTQNKIRIYYDVKREIGKVFNQEINMLKLGRIPAMFIIDKNGTIIYAYYSDTMDDIPNNTEIFDFLWNLKKYHPIF